jgi:hypothetical protein
MLDSLKQLKENVSLCKLALNISIWHGEGLDFEGLGRLESLDFEVKSYLNHLQNIHQYIGKALNDEPMYDDLEDGEEDLDFWEACLTCFDEDWVGYLRPFSPALLAFVELHTETEAKKREMLGVLFKTNEVMGEQLQHIETEFELSQWTAFLLELRVALEQKKPISIITRLVL